MLIAANRIAKGFISKLGDKVYFLFEYGDEDGAYFSTIEVS